MLFCVKFICFGKLSKIITLAFYTFLGYVNYFHEKKEEDAHKSSTNLFSLLSPDSHPVLLRPRGGEPGRVIDDQWPHVFQVFTGPGDMDPGHL